MPEELPQFSHAALEADILRLTREIREHRARPENGGMSNKEVVKQSIRAFTPTPAVPFGDMSQKATLSTDLDNAPPEAKLEVEYLLDMALHEGIEKANGEASKSSPFVLDAFHDILTDRLYPELKKRGIVD